MKTFILFLTLLVVLNGVAQEKTSPIHIDSLDTKKDINEIPFSIIEDVPVYQGCKKDDTAEQKRKCMSSKIAQFITNHFNHKLLNNPNIEPGEIRIIVVFKIDKKGNVTGIKARSKHIQLETEAIRVIKKIPQFDSPGKFKGKPVEVPYSLPILLKKNVIEKQDITFPTHKRCTKITNKEVLKNCTKKKISEYIQMSVNMELASQLFPTDKSTQFQAIFTVDKKGNLKNITAKAHKRALAAEVIKALKRMPKLKKPAMLMGEPVEFKFSQLMTIYF